MTTLIRLPLRESPRMHDRRPAGQAAALLLNGFQPFTLGMRLRGGGWPALLSVLLLSSAAVFAIVVLVQINQTYAGAQYLKQAWRADELEQMAKIGGIFVLVGNLVALALGVLNLPLVHRGDSISRSFLQSWKAALAGIPMVATWVAAALLIGQELIQIGVFPHEGMIALMLLLSVCGVVAWINRICRGIRDETLVALPPLCESCGYDLTGRAPGELCPECGVPVQQSLLQQKHAAGARRPLWLITLLRVLIGPAPFYRRLAVRRGDGTARRFAAGTFIAAFFTGVCIVVLAMWLESMLSPWGRFNLRELPIALIAASFGTLALWGMWRAAALLGSFPLLLGKSLPDVAAIRCVIGFESAFIALVGAAWTLYALLMVVTSDWITRASGLPTILGIPAGAYVLLGMTLVLLGVWVLRVRRGILLTRWSNS